MVIGVPFKKTLSRSVRDGGVQDAEAGQLAEGPRRLPPRGLDHGTVRPSERRSPPRRRHETRAGESGS